MDGLSIIILCIFLICTVNAYQEECKTLTDEKGKCVSIYSCPSLLAIVNKTKIDVHDRRDLRKVHCGFEGGTPFVCCEVSTAPDPLPPSQCLTPKGQIGECLSLNLCTHLNNLLEGPQKKEVEQYVEQSKCKGSDNTVCCGAAPSFTRAARGSCAASVSAYPPDPSSKCCGDDGRVGNKIFGGEPTGIDHYPWLSLIEYKKGKVIKTMCGGGLISGRYVLTAGHCVIGPILEKGRPTIVRLGEYDTKHEGPDCVTVEANGRDCTEGVTRIAIEKTIPHPEYNPASSQKRHDIALIRLKEMAPYNDFIRPICLPTVDRTLGTESFNVTVAGWGAVSSRERSSRLKLHVEVPIVPREKCQEGFSYVKLWEGHVCAGGEKGKDSCKGDSGGPLMYENGRKYEAIALVSFGPQFCGTENIPGVYTNIYQYNSWIRETIVD